MMKTRLSCSECGEATYVRGMTSDVECESCGNEVNWVDFQPDNSEVIDFDDSDDGDGYLVVYLPN